MNHFFFLKLLCCLLLVYIITPVQKADEKVCGNQFESVLSNETKKDIKMKWFRDAHFGMFIHWGLYAQYSGEWKGKPALMPNGCAEWLMLVAKASRAEYSSATKDFNPIRFNAESWVLSAKDAGFKYIIFTSKHHEGFAMFKTNASEYNIVDATPFKRDVLKELVAACRKYDIKIGFYYSQNLDWYHIGGGGGDWDPTHKGDNHTYVEKIVLPQIKEILTNYGKIDVLWYDIPNGAVSKEDAVRIDKLVHELQPDILVNNRLGRGVYADIQTPEQFIPATGLPGKDWETCMTMNCSWGFSKNDHNWKSSRKMIQTLVDATSKGGNLLLNVGPTALGEIPTPSLERMSEIGKWLKTNGEAIYGTRASLFVDLPEWGRWTTRIQKDKSILYAIVFDVPKSRKIQMSGLINKIKESYILETKEKVSFKQYEESGIVSFQLPESVLNKKDFVVAIYIDSLPIMNKWTYSNTTEKIILSPQNANCIGNIKLSELNAHGLAKPEPICLENWKSYDDSVIWDIYVNKTGFYKVVLNYSAVDIPETVLFNLSVNDKKSQKYIPQTGGWNKFKNVELGKINLNSGLNKLQINAFGNSNATHSVFYKIRSVTLIPE